MTVIRRGVTRTVFLVGRWAVKVPTLRPVGAHRGLRARLAGFAEGYLANLSEHTWSQYGPYAGKVAPVLHSWLFGVVQVYPRCEPMSHDEWIWDGPGAWVYHGPDEMPVLEPDPGDFKPDNYGRLCGRIVRVDYSMR